MWRRPEQRYQKMEKATYIVVPATRKLGHYFQCHSIVVKTCLPIQQVLLKPDLVGRMVSMSVELLEYYIKYESRGPIKAHTLKDFIAELVKNDSEDQLQADGTWTLSVDGSSHLRGSGAGVILEGLDGILLEQSTRFNFKGL